MTDQDKTPSLRVQLTGFFRRCPEGDTLTAEDAATKYRVDLSYAYRILKQMVSDGALETTMIASERRHCMVIAYRAVVREVA